MSAIKMKALTGGGGGEGHLSPWLVQTVADGTISYELSWRVNKMITKKKEGNTRIQALAQREIGHVARTFTPLD